MDKKKHIYSNPLVSASALQLLVDSQTVIFPAPQKKPNPSHINSIPQVNVPNATLGQDNSADDDGEIITYPRINPLPNLPTSDSHQTVKLYSPKPKLAPGYHSIRNNIIGYQEPATPSRSATSGSAQAGSGIPGLAGGVNANAIGGYGDRGASGHGPPQTSEELYQAMDVTRRAIRAAKKKVKAPKK